MHHATLDVFRQFRAVPLPGQGGQWPRVVTITLGPDDTAWNPVSTKGKIHGPATVTYREYQDGAVEATVS